METNRIIIVILDILALALISFLVQRNRKDNKKWKYLNTKKQTNASED